MVLKFVAHCGELNSTFFRWLFNLESKSTLKRAKKGKILKEDQLRFIGLSQKDHFDFQTFEFSFDCVDDVINDECEFNGKIKLKLKI